MLRPPPILNDLPVLMRGTKHHIYPTDALAPRESFFVPINLKKPTSLLSSIYKSIKKCKARYPKLKMRFIVRRVRENGVEGLRCWRIS
jgi:hypothetical protein